VVGVQPEQAPASTDKNFNIVHVSRYLSHHEPTTFVVWKQSAKSLKSPKRGFELHALILDNAPIVTKRSS
jgi:hypothetical protein